MHAHKVKLRRGSGKKFVNTGRKYFYIPTLNGFGIQISLTFRGYRPTGPQMKNLAQQSVQVSPPIETS